MARPGLVRVASGAQEARLRLCKRPDDSGGLLLALQSGLPGRPKLSAERLALRGDLGRALLLPAELGPDLLGAELLLPQALQRQLLLQSVSQHLQVKY